MVKKIAYKLRFIDSFRFMSTSLSEVVDNMSGIFNSIECKSCIGKIIINSECCFVGLKNNKINLQIQRMQGRMEKTNK